MSIGQILKSWILTIAIGSLLAQILYIPIVLATKDEGWKFITGFFFSWTYVTLIMSTAFSIPTILILIAVNQNLKKKNVDLRTLDRRLTITQLTCGLLTFAFLILGFTFDAWDYLLVTAVAFISTGLIIWKKEIKKLATTSAIANAG